MVNSRDITERKKSEETLRSSEERFRVQFKGSPIPTYVWRRVQDEDDFVLIDHNDAAFTITRGNIADLLGTRAKELYPDRPWVQKRLRHCFEEHAYLKEETWWTFVTTGETKYLVVHFIFIPPDLVMVYTEDLTERKEAEETLRRSEERFRLLAENAQDFVFRYRFKPTPTFEYVSPSATVITGYTPEEYYADPELGLKIVHPDDRYLIDEVLRSPEDSVTIRWRRKDGRLVWAEQHNKPIYDETGELVAIEGIGRDVTDRRRAEEALRSSEEFFRALYEEVNHPIFLVDEDLNFIDVNPYACEFYGYSHEEFKHMKLRDITLPGEQDEHLRNVEELFEKGKMFVPERRHRKRNGEVVTVTVDVTRVIRSEQERYVSKITDITARVRLEERLRYQASHDALTDLPNRHLFVDRLGQALRRTRRRPERKVAVLFIDLDNFKVINDSLGHEAGDRLLVTVGERLKRCLRPEDTLVRFGGDEFAVLIEEVESPKEAVRVAERIVEGLRGPFALEDRELFVTASIGIALGDARTKSPEEILREADTAMYRAKEDHLGYRVFDQSMYEWAVSRLEMENDLKRAIEAQEFVVHYQPIVNLHTGETWGIEALVRWQHPERGLLDPSEFMATAEESRLVIPMGEWVLNEACSQAVKWQEEYPRMPPLVMAVNLSATQLNPQDLVKTIEGALRESGLDPTCLSLDITETVYIGTLENNLAALQQLRAMGVRISIDDFGTGYSSLSYLKRLPADTLKIDKSFIGGLGEDVKDTAIVQMIIDLAHTLGMEVVAEGVETAEQVANLRQMGCDLAQGFYFARSRPPKEITQFLAR